MTIWKYNENTKLSFLVSLGTNTIEQNADVQFLLIQQTNKT